MEHHIPEVVYWIGSGLGTAAGAFVTRLWRVSRDHKRLEEAMQREARDAEKAKQHVPNEDDPDAHFGPRSGEPSDIERQIQKRYWEALQKIESLEVQVKNLEGELAEKATIEADLAQVKAALATATTRNLSLESDLRLALARVEELEERLREVLSGYTEPALPPTPLVPPAYVIDVLEIDDRKTDRVPKEDIHSAPTPRPKGLPRPPKLPRTP